MSSITVGRTGSGFVIRIGAHGTLRESRTMVEFIAHATGTPDIDLDLSGTSYLDSTFLGSLMGLHKRINLAHQGQFRVCGPVEHTRRLMGKTRLDGVLILVPEVPSRHRDEQDIPLAVTGTDDLARFIADAHRKLAELGGPDSSAYVKVAERLEEETRHHSRP